MSSETDLLRAMAFALAGAAPSRGPVAMLAEIGPRFDADRAWFLRFSADQTVWWIAHEWCAPGVPACLPDLPGVPTALIAVPMVEFVRGRAVVYHDIEKIPVAAQDLKEEMRREGNRATAATPLFRDGRLVALIGVDDTRKVHRWTPQEMALLGRAGEIVLAADARSHADATADGRPPAPEPNGCYLRAGDCHIQVRWSEVLGIQAEGDYTRVRLAGGQQFLERRSLAQWEVFLPAEQFGRVHRSWIVNWQEVHRLHRGAAGRWSLDLRRADVTVPVGRAYQEIVRERLQRMTPRGEAGR